MSTTTTLADRCGEIWDRIRQGTRRYPARVTIPRDHVDESEKLGAAFGPDLHYFQVRVNEMYLTYSRKWFSEYDPMVFVVTEFTYGQKKNEAVPFVVGPVMMEKYGQKVPTGMVFLDTRVAGPHPYRGDRLTLSVVLCRVKRHKLCPQIIAGG